MKEREIIAAVAERLARSPRQRNALFASDAEIIEVGGELLAVTVDDYSAEDRLSPEDPHLLGWNLVAATVSDLLAVGAVPRFMLNSLVATRSMDAAYLRALSDGMSAALETCGATMAGGDVGTGADWRFTGVALGDFPAGRRPLSRRPPRGAGVVLVSGACGDANLAAGAGGPAPRFELRLPESAALAAIAAAATGVTADGAATGVTADDAAAVACIDTSDGLASALESIAALDPGVRVEIDLDAVPYAPGVIEAAAKMSVPPELFLMGSAGEYELLALVGEEGRGDARRAGALEAGLRPIGTFTSAGQRGLRLSMSGTPPGLFFRRGSDARAARLIAQPVLPDPREAPSLEAYCASLIDLARRTFGAPGRV